MGLYEDDSILYPMFLTFTHLFSDLQMKVLTFVGEISFHYYN